jgi:hypothetical protein
LFEKVELPLFGELDNSEDRAAPEFQPALGWKSLRREMQMTTNLRPDSKRFPARIQ